MADWTSGPGSFIRPYRSALGSPYIRYFEASTAASSAVRIHVGDIVQFDTAVASNSHRLTMARSTGGNGGNLLGINGAQLVGVAIEADDSDGSTKGLGTGRKIGVAIFDRQTEFLAYTRWAGPVTSTMIGTGRSIIYDSTHHIWQIDSTNSTAALQTAIIVDVPDQYIGDTGAPVVFRISPSSLVSVAIRPV